MTPRGFDPAFDARFDAARSRAWADGDAAPLPLCPDCGTRGFYALAMAGDRWVCRCTGRSTVRDAIHAVRVQ